MLISAKLGMIVFFHEELPSIKLQVMFFLFKEEKCYSSTELSLAHLTLKKKEEHGAITLTYFYTVNHKRRRVTACKHVNYRFLKPAFSFINATLFRRHSYQKHNKKHNNIWCVLTFIYC